MTVPIVAEYLPFVAAPMPIAKIAFGQMGFFNSPLPLTYFPVVTKEKSGRDFAFEVSLPAATG